MAEFGDLFKEIGNTLVDVAKDTIRTGTATLRSALAERYLATPGGQQMVTEFKFREIGRMLPLLIAIVLGVFIFGWIARRA